MQNSQELNSIAITVSICLFCYNNDEKKVLTVKNENAPFKGALILPNQFLKSNQSLEDVCSDILNENIGNNNIYVEQLNAFGKLYRHPDGRVIDISFYGLINLEKDKVVLNKSKNAEFTNLESFPELAFDHNEMVDIALKRIKRRIWRDQFKRRNMVKLIIFNNKYRRRHVTWLKRSFRKILKLQVWNLKID